MTLFVTHLPLFVTFPLAALCLTVACFLPMLLLSPTSIQRKGMEMIIRIGRMRLQISTPEQKLKEDFLEAQEQEKIDKQIADYEALTKQEKIKRAQASHDEYKKFESDLLERNIISKVGRNKYYSRIGILETPRVIIDNIKCYLTNTKVFYTDDGCRCETRTIIGR